MAQKDQSDRQNSYQRRMRDENTRTALDAYDFSVNQEQTKLMQDQTAAGQEIHQNSLRRREAAGRALASSESAGLNLDTLMGDFLRQEADFNSSINQQMDWKKQQSTNNIKGYAARAKNRIASYNPAPAPEPSLAASVAGFGVKAVDAYGRYSLSKKGE